MSNDLTKQQVDSGKLFELMHKELDNGNPFSKLPLKAVDWNDVYGKKFLKRRCARDKGNGAEIVRNLPLFRLKDENLIEILCSAIESGVSIKTVPAEVTFKGGEEKCKKLWDKIIECKKGKEYLEVLRSFRAGDMKKKLHAYDYIVAGYKRRGFDALPESKVIFGKFEEEEQDDRQREKVRREQQLLDAQQIEEEQKRKAIEKQRRTLLTPARMNFLTKELKENGVSAIKTLWRTDALGILHHYIDMDDVKDHPVFIETLTQVIDNAINKGFEETYRCVRAFPLVYGGQARYDVPPVVEKAFKKYPAMLKAVSKEFEDQLDPREKQDYFFFTKVAVTNPKFDWYDIDLSLLPEDGAVIYTENDEKVVLSLREQLEDIVITAYEAGVRNIPKEFLNYDHNYLQFNHLEVLAVFMHKRHNNAKQPQAEQEPEKQEAVKQEGGIRGIFKSIFRK